MTTTTKRTRAWVTTGIIAIISLLFAARRLRAADAPAEISLAYAGTLEDPDGTPTSGAHDLVVDLWDSSLGAAAGNPPLCEAVSSQQQLEAGRFRVTFLPACSTALAANPEAWVEVVVDRATLGLAKIGAVPRALRATRADTATTAGTAATANLATLATTATRATTADSAARSTADFTVGRNLAVAGDVAFTGRLSLGLRQSTDCQTYVYPGSANDWVTDCSCGSGEMPLGGGGYSTSGHSLQESRSLAFSGTNAWRVACGDLAGNRVKCDYADAYCARIAP